MIKNESAYQKAVDKLKEDQKFIASEKKRFKEMGLNSDQIKMAIDPLLSFHEQLKEEVEHYEKIKRGSFNPIYKFTDIGKTLIAYRIYTGMTQAELAEKLGVSNSQISRDERHEYYGATAEKIESVMEAMGMKATINIEVTGELGAS
ncbi:helix-turn-helix domain-containing protein [Oceanobacillus alkalisoli]|uniref:helix-turn-helix domain-containing protein n=1 Tax=Oceanobacillus alkalisoli TaxID=2925113 RepID=UPI001EF0D205|nr:helix-turn-helix transcriptional regulator [Oceanobacillus alkalisoli]MCF3944144.1 helix-turn-helix domain-containing protein [Oceanobacillus alkalisoli]MCG5102541.1 helix-turn-helix domain-containing protein [Oceanobacillus alkalisoli]